MSGYPLLGNQCGKTVTRYKSVLISSANIFINASSNWTHYIVDDSFDELTLTFEVPTTDSGVFYGMSVMVTLSRPSLILLAASGISFKIPDGFSLTNLPNNISIEFIFSKDNSWILAPWGVEDSRVLLNAGYFSEGFTYTSANQIGVTPDGQWWSYNGSLPFTVAAGTVPSAPTYTQRGDEALRSALAAPDSTVPVGGVAAGVLANAVFNVKAYGLKGDGVTDDAPALQSLVNLVQSSGGGTIFFTNGAYKLNSMIQITGSSLTFKGTGQRKVYAGLYTPDADGVSTIFPNHTGRAIFEFFSNSINAVGGISFTDLAIARVVGMSVPGRAFGWNCGNFQYGFNFQRCSIQNHVSAFDVYKTAGNITDQMAALNVSECNINANSWIARTLDGTVWNGFTFKKNNAGQNGFESGTGGINITGTSIVIEYNIMEGQRDPIRISGLNSPVRAVGNYFEHCTGVATTQISGSRGPVTVGGCYNFSTLFPINFTTIIADSPFVDCEQPYWPSGVYRAKQLSPHQKNSTHHYLGKDVGNIYTSTNRWIRIDDVPVVAKTEPKGVVSIIRRGGRRELNPIHGGVMNCLPFSSGGTPATNVVAISIGGVTRAAGEWIVVSLMIKHDQPITAEHPMYNNWPVGVLDGSQDVTLANAFQCLNAGEFYVYTFAYRCQTAINNVTVQCNVYPYGISNPAVGLTAAVSGYTVQRVSNVHDVVPYCDFNALSSVTSAPATGTWLTGDTLKNATPTAGGYERFVCVAGGSPGTWKGAGLIEA